MELLTKILLIIKNFTHYIEQCGIMNENIFNNMEISQILAKNFNRLRKERGISLTGVAERAGISKSTLSSLESGQANPTISTLWALADAMEVPFGSLIAEPDHGSAKICEAGVSVRLIEQSDCIPRIESYLMSLSLEGQRNAAPHSHGVIEHVSVLKGSMLVGPSNSPNLLRVGGSLSFKADQPHIYIAVDGPASALVTMDYLKEEVFADPNTISRPLPKAKEEWEGLLVLLRRLWEEAAQGVSVFRLRLNCQENNINNIKDELKKQLERLKHSNFNMPLKYFIVIEGEDISLFIFSWPRGIVEMFSFPEKKTGLFKQASSIQLLAKKGILSIANTNYLRSIANSASITLSTLAAESLRQQGQPVVPSQVFTLLNQGIAEARVKKNEFPLFEDRINVNMYNSFELLHPGYAYQAVTLARMVQRHYTGSVLSVLDVGTGPGTHLMMLLEFFPGFEVMTVDPSPTAFAYLNRNLNGFKNVRSHLGDFLEFNIAERFPIILSVGASHHLNSAFFLQKSYDIMDNEGILFVADEFISPYSTVLERARNLISHHSAYMLATLVELPEDVRKYICDEEQYLISQLSINVPFLAYEAEIGKVEAAISRARQLFSNLRRLKLPLQPSHPLLAFYFFQVLELEALVAGLDYEVERKTSPERFISLAQVAGFSLLEHRRIYATSGIRDVDAGTHVFAFRKAEVL